MPGGTVRWRRVAAIACAALRHEGPSANLQMSWRNNATGVLAHDFA
jgi:hypothetical protein